MSQLLQDVPHPSRKQETHCEEFYSESKKTQQLTPLVRPLFFFFLRNQAAHISFSTDRVRCYPT